jgi:hypothetical protein
VTQKGSDGTDLEVLGPDPLPFTPDRVEVAAVRQPM